MPHPYFRVRKSQRATRVGQIRGRHVDGIFFSFSFFFSNE